jgi:hypothetical protein
MKAGVAPTANLNGMRRSEKAEVLERAWAKRSGGREAPVRYYSCDHSSSHWLRENLIGDGVCVYLLSLRWSDLPHVHTFQRRRGR